MTAQWIVEIPCDNADQALSVADALRHLTMYDAKAVVRRQAKEQEESA